MSIDLSAQQKRSLRSRGRVLKPQLMIGKDGLTPASTAQADTLLDRLELIKVRVLDAASESAAALAQELASHTSSAVVAVVGKTFLLYRPAEPLGQE